MNTKASLIIFSCVLSAPALSASLFVSPAGAGATCLAKTPCASIQAAVDVSAPGDTINIAAGEYRENVTIPPGKNRLHIRGTGEGSTRVISAGGDAVPKQAPPGVPIDVVFDIVASDVTLEKLSIEHPNGVPDKRDLGVFVRPPAANVTIQKTTIQRNRTGKLEPTNPGSRGIFVLQAKGTTISKNVIRGNYEDHLHIPSSHTTIDHNKVSDAKRVGIVIIQENATSDSTQNAITGNTVTNSGGDGIQIQGDENTITKNTVSHSGGAGIRLCGAGNCVAPGTAAVADRNQVTKNKLENNKDGDVVDNGSGNTIQ
ncbi:MAG TPA: right-handed parallel beta-helix repeat-containing protein [Thiobacillus sp.]